ncbi:XrtA/PEP-CTERM system-associated ATPase [Lacisediminimonas profundi]|uniref:XrtA/PEP-CTERM system-associated ATPase n=1 Tax=Lacisediminimonas profundi TaxID=2603856 RepID=UPI00124B13A0|nr:XrtA/PEP-CTERM system-associated ATPase [Lacisediminimonas profundi]
MYNDYYGFNAKPFQLKPDPDFFFGSKGHSRAMAYLQYGLSQDEGFIVITGDVGAGKTTLVRNLCRRLPADRIVVANIVNSALDNSVDVLRMVLAAFRQPFENISKAAMLMRLEMFMNECHGRGKRLLLIVDEAQNLSRPALEELRMLSNLHIGDTPMLQTFLLGQPEFRETMMSVEMSQLRQRVRATYHLGPLDEDETRTYIEHRLHRVGWRNDPEIDGDAHRAIHSHAGGIPRNINTLCDRLFLMGYLEELHHFGGLEVQQVIDDLQQEFSVPPTMMQQIGSSSAGAAAAAGQQQIEQVQEQVERMESSLASMLDALRKLVTPSRMNGASGKDR